MAKRLLLGLPLALALALAGCPDDKPGTTDTGGDISADGVDGDAGDVSVDGADAPDGPDAPDVGPVTPALSFVLTVADPGGTSPPFIEVGAGEELVQLVAGHDRDPDADGVQVEVSGTATGVAAGQPVTLSLDGAVVGDPEPLQDDGRVVFVNVTLPPSVEGFELRIEATTPAGATVSDAKTIEVYVDPCAVELTAPAEGACATADADPERDGVQVQVVATVAEPTLCAAVTLSVDDGVQLETLEPTAWDEDSGEATFDVTVPGEAVEASVEVFASASHSVHETLDGSSAARTVTVDTLPPSVTFAAPGADKATLVLADDEDAAQDGIQLTVTATTTEAGAAEARLLLDGGEIATATLDEGALDFGPVTFTGSGVEATLTVEVTDACGNVGAAEHTLTVFGEAPGVVVESPGAGDVLLASGNGPAGTATVYDVPFQVSVTTPSEGATLTVQCRDSEGSPNTFFQAGQITLAAPFPDDGRWDVPVLIDTVLWSNTVVCRARLDGPNQATSGVVALTAAIPGPTVTLAAPPADTCLSDKTAVPFSGTATGLDGQPLVFRVVKGDSVAAEVSPGDAPADGVYSATVDLTAAGPFTDGSFEVCVDGTDAWGNVASDLAAPACQPVVFDTVPPLLVQVQPAGTYIDGALDEDPALPGFQTTIVMQLNNESALPAQICLELVQDLGCKDVDNAFRATWTGVTLLPGFNNPLTATGTDACGNAAGVYKVTLELDLDAPVVTIVSPAADLVTVSDTTDVTVALADAQSGDPLTGADVALTVGGVASGVAAIDNGDGTYAFVAVPLAAGANAVQATATLGADSGASPVRTITYKTAQPAIALTSPQSDALVNLASAACSAPGATCVTTASAALTDTEDGSTASLAVDCVGAAEVVTVEAAVTGGAVTWTGVPLAHGGACTLTPSVVDAAGQSASGDPVSVTVDRLAPQILSFDAPLKDFLTFVDDQDIVTPGLQHPLTVVIGGVEAGQVLTVTMNADPTYEQTLTVGAAIPDGGSVDLDFGDVDYPAGVVVLVATVSDAAGNVATFTKQVNVVVDAPSVRITTPGWPGDACGACAATAACDGGACWHKWGLAYEGQGGLIGVTATGYAQATDNLRICSDAAALAGSGEVCDSAGGPFYEVKVVEATGVNQLVSLEGLLPAGPQTLVAELLPTPGAVWTSSLDEQQVTSQLRRVLVDLDAPAVTALTSPSDTEAPTGVLNLAEQLGAPAPAGTYQLQISADDGAAAVWVNGAKVATVDVSGGTGSAQVTLSHGANSVYVVVTDSVGNTSAPAASALKWTPTVDLVAPTVAFQHPDGSDWVGGADSADVVVAVGLEDGEAAGGDVILLDAGAQVATAPLAGGVATFAGALAAEGAHTFTATATDAAGNPGSGATSPATVTVDWTAPLAQITGPSNGTVVDADADAATPGFQVAVDFDAGDGASDAMWELAVATCPDGTYTGCGTPAPAASGTVSGAATSLAELVTIEDIQGTDNWYVLTLTATDQAGNVTTDTLQLQVTITNCAVSFVDLPAAWFNAGHCLPATACDVHIKARAAGGCGSTNTLILYDGATALAAQVVLAGTTATFTVPVADGQQLALKAEALVGPSVVGSSPVRDRGVDLTAPTCALEATSVDGFTTPTTGEVASYGFDADQAPLSTATCEVHAFARMTDTNAAGGGLGSVLAAPAGGGASTVLTPDVSTAPGASSGELEITLRDLSLPNQLASEVTILVQDAAGNSATCAFTGDVDLDPPGALTVSVSGVDARLPGVTLAWTAVDEDGAGGSGGAAASYQVRYSRSPITSANWASACEASALEHTPALPTPGAPGASELGAVFGPDPRPASEPCRLAPDQSNGTWYFAARAVDAHGNRSAVAGSSVASTDLITFRFSRVVFGTTLKGLFPPGMGNFVTAFGHVVGDVDGDGFADMAVGSAFNNGFCLIFGAAAPPAVATLDQLCDDGNDATGDGCDLPTAGVGLRHACAIGTAGFLAGATSFGTALRPVGDVNGDGIADFGVSGNDPSGQQGFLAVYLGRLGRGPDPAAPNVLIRGADRLTNNYFQWCGAGPFTGEVNGGKPIDSLAIGEPDSDRIRVIGGSAVWSNTGEITIDLDNLVGNEKVLTLQAVEPGNEFGAQCAPAGDLRGGAEGDLLVSQSARAGATSVQWQVLVIPGRFIAAGEATSTLHLAHPPAAPTAEDGQLIRLRQQPPDYDDFPYAVLGGRDVTADGTADVVITQRTATLAQGGDGRSIWVFDGDVIAAAAGGAMLKPGVPAAVTGTTSQKAPNGFAVVQDFVGFRESVALVAWTGWTWQGVPTVDLIAIDGGEARLRLDHAQDGGPLEPGLFPFVDADIVKPGGGTFSSFVRGGDVDGDGVEDAIMGTFTGELVIMR